ncbi:hypothetical protein KAM470_12830 [Aeromonas caviae]|nr:hypothetical protein KAM470_12830 [Aeromonas caviae]
MNAVKMIQKGNQLELPLFFLDEEPKTAEVIPFEPKPAWNDDEVRLLRDGLLWHSLRVLADGRAGSEIKQETMTWVMSDEVHPFSFLITHDPQPASRADMASEGLPRLHAPIQPTCS